MKKRTFLAALAAAPLAPMLSACGGGSSDSGKAKVRFVNASIGYDSLDFYLDNDQKASAVAYGSASGYSKVDSDTFDLAVRSAGSSISLSTTSRTFSKDSNYSIVAFGDEGELATTTLAENADDPDNDYAKLRLYNRLDVPVGLYIADEGGSKASAVAVVASVSAGQSSGYVQEGKGTYTLYVTTVADKAADRDVLLKIDSITLADQQIATLVAIPSAGAVLANAILLNQGDDATAYTNGTVRVRLVSGVAGKTVAATVGGVALSGGSGLNVGDYQDVAYSGTGTLAVNVTVDGESVSAAALAASRGGDYTLVVYGDDDIQVKVLTDDNELPSDSDATSMRFVHLAPSHADDPLSLFLNNSKQIALNVAYGEASTYTDQTASSDASSNTLQIKVGQNGTTIVTATDTAIDANAVYTVFCFGEGDAYFVANDREKVTSSS